MGWPCSAGPAYSCGADDESEINREVSRMLSENHAPIRPFPAALDEKKIETVIDGFHVTMNFPENTNGSSLETVRSILKSAYLNSLTD